MRTRQNHAQTPTQTWECHEVAVVVHDVLADNVQPVLEQLVHVAVEGAWRGRGS